MKLTFNLACISLLLMLCITSCNKNNSNPTNNTDTYVSGAYRNAAVYWKNGNLVSVGSSDVGSVGRIAVYGNDVYLPASAFTDTDLYEHAIYWKNGKLTDLGHGRAESIAVNGNDIYVVGEADENNTFYAACWKNGVLTTYGQLGDISQVIVSGNDIYMAGITYDTSGSPIATYWKNNVPVSLGYGQINSIAVSGNDVYAVGYGYPNRTNSLCYWKNGQQTILGDATMTANAIIVSGSDFYIAGSVQNGGTKSTYWKNGVPVTVTSASKLSGIAVDGNNVYLSGNYTEAVPVNTPPTNSLLIINGKVTTLASSTGFSGDAPTATTWLVAVKR